MSPGETLARLDDYLSGEMSESEAEAFEADLFENADLLDAASVLPAVARRVRELAARGTLSPFVTAADVAQIQASDLDVQIVDFPKDVRRVHVAIRRSLDILVLRHELDLAGVERLESEWGTPELGFQRLDAVFDPADAAAFQCCEGDYVRFTISVLPAGVVTLLRFYAVEGSERRLIAEWEATNELVD